MSIRVRVLALSAAGITLAACSAQPGATDAPAVLPTPSTLRPLAVAAVQVEVGVGSPIPVEIVASGDWPDQCAQLAQLEQNIDGSSIEITLLATPADPDCPPDFAGVPFRIAVPLNIVQLAPGDYTVSVNGVSAAFEWTGTSPTGSLPAAPMHLAYLGPDGNVRALEWPGGSARQLTSDATSPTDAASISYNFPQISSDGRMVAFRRDEGLPGESGLDFTFGLWVHDLDRGMSREVLDQIPAGFAWQPGTHLLAYDLAVPTEYFIFRGQPSPELARGIQGIDLDSGQVTELVQPERGYSLVRPSWSPDGRILAFQELFNMEGSGFFGYADLETGQYTAWEQAIGLSDWSPDGGQLAYDTLTYTATGTEQIFLRGIPGGVSQPFTPVLTPGYTFSPIYAPAGDQIAYLASLEGPDSQQFTVFVQSLAGGEPRSLGVYESALDLAWSPDGAYLLFSAGPHGQQQLLAVDAVTGASSVLAAGWQLDVGG